MQKVSSGCGEWPKKSKLVVKEIAAACSTTEDCFSKADSSRGDTVGDVLDRFGFDVDGDEEHEL